MTGERINKVKKNIFLLTKLILFFIIGMSTVQNSKEGAKDENHSNFKNPKTNRTGFDGSCSRRIVFDSSLLRTVDNGSLTPTSNLQFKRCIMSTIHTSTHLSEDSSRLFDELSELYFVRHNFNVLKQVWTKEKSRYNALKEVRRLVIFHDMDVEDAIEHEYKRLRELVKVMNVEITLQNNLGMKV